MSPHGTEQQRGRCSNTQVACLQVFYERHFFKKSAEHLWILNLFIFTFFKPQEDLFYVFALLIVNRKKSNVVPLMCIHMWEHFWTDSKLFTKMCCFIYHIPGTFASLYRHAYWNKNGWICSSNLINLSVCSLQDLNKRLSLPADIRIPDGYLEKLQLSSPPFDQPLSRRSRRASLVSASTSSAWVSTEPHNVPLTPTLRTFSPSCSSTTSDLFRNLPFFFASAFCDFSALCYCGVGTR